VRSPSFPGKGHFEKRPVHVSPPQVPWQAQISRSLAARLWKGASAQRIRSPSWERGAGWLVFEDENHAAEASASASLRRQLHRCWEQLSRRGSRRGGWMPRQAGMRRFGGAVSSLYRGWEQRRSLRIGWLPLGGFEPPTLQDAGANLSGPVPLFTIIQRTTSPGHQSGGSRTHSTATSSPGGENLRVVGNLSGFRHRRLFRASQLLTVCTCWM
jgi:hypothetical protein